MPRGCGFCQAGREGCASALFEMRRAFLSSSLPTAGSLRRHVDLPLRTAFVKRAERGCKASTSFPWTEALSFMHFYTFIFLHICVFAYFGEKGRVPAFFYRARAPRMPAATPSRQQKTGEAFASPVSLPCPSPPACTLRRGASAIILFANSEASQREPSRGIKSYSQSSPAVGVV